jgi:hypothetical protein
VSDPSTPKAFVSHASEDKDRFVLGFGERLRADGVDAWVDQWEMSPGDSLIRRIFDEGIAAADVFIVVLSAHSIDKPWVREELDAGVVRKIEGDCRLIPVVLDNVAVPTVLKATVWQTINDTTSYDADYARILNAIHGVSARPPVGPPPAYTTGTSLTGLNQADSAVLTAICETAIASGVRLTLIRSILARTEAAGLGRDAVTEALLALEQAGLIGDVQTLLGGGISRFTLRWDGLLRYLDAIYSDLAAHQQNLLARLVNDQVTSWPLSDLAADEGIPQLVAEALLAPYEQRGLLTFTRYITNAVTVGSVSPLLRRELA